LALRYSETEAAFRHFETPFLRAEVPLVNAEIGPPSTGCQIFLEFPRGNVAEQKQRSESNEMKVMGRALARPYKRSATTIR
jgi:hypothetical protein